MAGAPLDGRRRGRARVRRARSRRPTASPSSPSARGPVQLTGFSTSTTDADAALRTISIDTSRARRSTTRSSLSAQHARRRGRPRARDHPRHRRQRDVSSEATLDDAIATAHATADASVYVVGDRERRRFTPAPLQQHRRARRAAATTARRLEPRSRRSTARSRASSRAPGGSSTSRAARPGEQLAPARGAEPGGRRLHRRHRSRRRPAPEHRPAAGCPRRSTRALRRAPLAIARRRSSCCSACAFAVRLARRARWLQEPPRPARRGPRKRAEAAEGASASPIARRALPGDRERPSGTAVSGASCSACSSGPTCRCARSSSST